MPQPFENERLALAVILAGCVLLGILIAIPFILAERYVKRRFGDDLEQIKKSPLLQVLYAMAIVARFFGGGGGGGSWGGGGGTTNGGGSSSKW